MKLIVAMFAVSLPACVLDEPVAPVKSETTSALLCPLILCGENAATAGDGILFDELDLFGRPNYAGTALIGANLSGGRSVRIDIIRDHLRAFDSAGTSYERSALLDMQVHFRFTPTGELFDLLLVDINEKDVTYRSGAREVTPVYDFKARRAGHNSFDYSICNNDPLPFDPTWSGLSHHALLYRGDRYDPTTKSLMANDPWDGWSFIACNGSAATKLELYRHTFAGGFDANWNPRFMTSLYDRTAFLKAITADYCGTGGPQFTVNGTPLAFATTAEPSSFPSLPYVSVRSVEAEWGVTNTGAIGAICLDHPRLEAAGITHDLVEWVCHRPFPSCGPVDGRSGAPLNWTTNSHVVTANPNPV